MTESPNSNDLIVDRDMAPKFAEIYSFLQLFHGHLEIQPVALADLEEFFGEGYDDFKSPAVQAHWQLLKGVGKRGDLYTWQAIAVKFAHGLGIIDEKINYGSLSKMQRLDIFKAACDNQFDCNLKFKLEVNKLPAELLRLSPVGLDMDGNRHWFFQDHEDGLCLYSDGNYQHYPVQPTTCRDYCRTVDELSQCINQLEAEIDDGMCDRHTCNGEAVTSDSKSVVGCMKCQEDTNYEQMLLCDQCNGECHTYCLYPPLFGIPSGTWVCPQCDQKCLLDKLKVLLFEAEAAQLRHKTTKQRMQRKVERLARSGVNCGNIIMHDFTDDDGVRRSHRSRTAVNYADLCDLDLTPIEERRKHKKHSNKSLSRAARYDVLREKRGLRFDAESSPKESSYSSDPNIETPTENDEDSNSNISDSEEQQLTTTDYGTIGKTYRIDGDLQYPMKKKIKKINNEDGLDQSSDADSTVDIIEQ
ncbi:remodeling and spacing factor 1-like [Dysidea avara]|uniref:remodeling and spacing factor 1-like n=1 Tax=Dysidea avara TaxID=196820 RepID=UPI00332249C2